MESIKESYYRYLRYFLSKDDTTATNYDRYMALAYAVRSEMVDNWIKTQRNYHEKNIRRVYFLSLEYIFGKSLYQNILNANLTKGVNAAAREVGFSLEELYQCEDDLELGNGGKARLAASFQEAMATLSVPALAYGIRFDYAQFRQRINGGIQQEKPYDWLHKGHPWEIIRPEYQCIVTINGKSVAKDPAAPSIKKPHRLENADTVIAVPSDMPVSGYGSGTVNTLRLWSARAAEEFLNDYSNHNDYERACEDMSRAGRVSKVLIPEGDVLRATGERLKQQFFLVSTSLQDIVRRHKQHNSSIRTLHEKAVIHINGSRCALAVPEMMRLLVDVEELEWDEAWAITRNLFAYTSHAVSRENLEIWPVYIMEQILPRHMEIINQLNFDFLEEVRAGGKYDIPSIQELSCIEEGEVKRVRMGQLAILGSSSVNGVSEAHTQVLKNTVFTKLIASRGVTVKSITNGISHRRWMLCNNRLMADLICEAIGDGWIRQPKKLEELERFCGDKGFLEKVDEVKRINKTRLAISVQKMLGMEIDMEMLFDVQCKKIHPFKRQTLHIFNIIHRYLQLKKGIKPLQPRLHIFAGKAMPSDFLAKQIIALIHILADVINNDADAKDMMRVLFVPDYGVSWAERILPAAELAEEIATPSFEACATTNFKMALNGALLLASRSWANRELIKRLGEENVFIFGSSELIPAPVAHPWELIKQSGELKDIFDFLENLLSEREGGEKIDPLVSSLRDSDRFRVLPEFADYLQQQTLVDTLYGDRISWAQKSLRSMARMSYFSSDRAVAEYASQIWKVHVSDS
jgi:starch phosphorylase